MWQNDKFLWILLRKIAIITPESQILQDKFIGPRRRIR